MHFDPAPLVEIGYAVASFFMLKEVIKAKRRNHVSQGVMPLLQACRHNPRLAGVVLAYSWAGLNILLAVEDRGIPLWVIRYVAQHIV